MHRRVASLELGTRKTHRYEEPCYSLCFCAISLRNCRDLGTLPHFLRCRVCL